MRWIATYQTDGPVTGKRIPVHHGIATTRTLLTNGGSAQTVSVISKLLVLFSVVFPNESVALFLLGTKRNAGMKQDWRQTTEIIGRFLKAKAEELS